MLSSVLRSDTAAKISIDIMRAFAEMRRFIASNAIAEVFKEIGWADELGSGIRNIKHYAEIYSNSVPVFIEGDVFKTIVKLKFDDKKPIIKSGDKKWR